MPVWSRPYVPATLLRAVDEVMGILDDDAHRISNCGGDAVELVAISTDVVPDDEPDRTDDRSSTSALPPELLTIIQLDVAEPGSVSPELAARIYGYDRDLLLSGIRESEVQMINWRNSVDEARQRDEEEALVCAGESATWQATTDLLRAALRVAVER